MIQSMTGYGKASKIYGNKKITVEVKSLNSKQVDVNTRLNPFYREKDIELRNLLTQRLSHGKIDLIVTAEEIASEPSTHINVNILCNYQKQLAEATKELNIEMPNNILELMLRMPEVFQSDTSRQLSTEEWEVVIATVNEAIDQLQSFRLQEGQSLDKMFREKIANIANLLQQVEPYEGERIEKIRIRLEENLKTLEDRIVVDRNRLEQEMIFYLEKLDVNEEKVRLRNHINYFLETLSNEAEPGKKLGFIAQEMGREINTLGSKSNHSEMQIIVVKMKDQLEQIKEQVLNVL
ncbi:MAG: YicC/YloC family endoribonuclease [Bacteroidales bacterium]|nr:YicC/YloC family endoribonuclease [Bacteroidales bacterium]